VYRTVEQFCSEFPDRLARDGVRVLKASRGNGGRTVWKVRVPAGPVRAALTPQTEVEVQHARIRDGSSASMPLAALLDRCAEAFDAWGGTAGLVDQEFVGGITRGIVRCYLVGGSVVGFARQYPEGAVPLGVLDVTPDSRQPAQAVMGLPSPKTMYPTDEPGFRGMRALLETDWVPGTLGLLGLGTDDLPALWDVDLLIADPEEGEVPRFVLCEVNVSSVIPFPPAAPHRVASHVMGALERHPH
jgi:hypothetical protein